MQLNDLVWDGQKLAKYRNKKDYNYDKLGKLIGVGAQALSSWEKNRSQPRGDKLLLLSQALEVDPVSFYERYQT